MWEDDTPIRYINGRLEIREGWSCTSGSATPTATHRAPGLRCVRPDLRGSRRMWLVSEHRGQLRLPPPSRAPGGRPSATGSTTRSRSTVATTRTATRVPCGSRPTGTVVPVVGCQRSSTAPTTPTWAPTSRRRVPPRARRWSSPGRPDRPTSSSWRVIDGKLDVIGTSPRDVVGATFEELLTMARGKYASGEGMR